MNDLIKKQLEEITKIIQLDPHDTGLAPAVWHILTALRGPDFKATAAMNDAGLTTYNIKLATTCIIRAHAFGLHEPERFGSLVRQDTPAFVEIRTRLMSVEWCHDFAHFIEHAMNAFYALGLKWNELNEWAAE